MIHKTDTKIAKQMKSDSVELKRLEKEEKLLSLKDKLKVLSAQIMKAKIERSQGIYVNVDKIQKEFAKVQAQHKKLYFN